MAAKSNKITKPEADKVVGFDSEASGVVFQTDAEYVLATYGEPALRKVEKRMKELGHDFSYMRISAGDHYPTGLRVLSLMVIKEVLNLTDEDIKIMGDNAPKISMIIRLMLKFFVSLEKALSKAPKAWEKHYSTGKLIIHEINREKKQIIVRLLDFKTHPLFLKYLEGYFQRFVQFTLPNEKVQSKLVKSMNKKDKYNEFKLYW